MTHCMISAPQPEAVEAGLDIFKAGGNVMDAAIAAAFVQTVVDHKCVVLRVLARCKSSCQKKIFTVSLIFTARRPKRLSQICGTSD